MKKRKGNVGKLLKSRWLWGLIGYMLCIYYIVVAGPGVSSIKNFYAMYHDVYVSLPMVILVALAIFMARLEKDFGRGFKIAFSRRANVSRMELQRAVHAVEYAEKSVILAAVLAIVFPMVDVFYHLDRTFLIGPVLAALSLHILYPTLLLVILYPVRARLEQLVISYMEEPEEGVDEQMEAEGQRLYFKLRALGLTDRETEVARLAASGMTNVEIGRELYISTATVKKHMTHIMEKMQCQGREELAERVRGL